MKDVRSEILPTAFLSKFRAAQRISGVEAGVGTALDAEVTGRSDGHSESATIGPLAEIRINTGLS